MARRLYTKRTYLLILLASVLLLFNLQAATAAPQSPGNSPALRLILNGKPSTAVPVLINKTPYIPLSPSVFTPLGITLSQNGSSFHFSSSAASGLFGMDLTATVNGEPVTLPQAAILHNGKRYAPIRLLTSLFGLDIVYRPKNAAIDIKSVPASQSLLFGYVTRKDGSPVKNGRMSITTESPDQKSKLEVFAVITDGFYRVYLRPDTVYQPYAVFDYGYANFLLPPMNPVELRGGQSFYLRTGSSKPNLTIHMQYPDGTPVKKATMFHTGHDPVIIINGIGLTTVQSGVKEIVFTQVSVEEKDSDWDVFERYTVPESGTGEIMLTLRRPNVTVDLTDSQGKQLYNELELVCRNPSGTEESYRETPMNGRYRFFLPDGQYELLSYYYLANRQTFPLNLRFSVVNGKPDRQLAWRMPDANVIGTVAFNDGSEITTGHITFYNSVTYGAISCWVNADGTFHLHVPDGTYRVDYSPFGPEPAQYFLDGEFVVKNGKPESDTEMIFYR